MKASELIEALKKGIEEHGDIPVFCYLPPAEVGNHVLTVDVVKDAFIWTGRKEPFLLIATDEQTWPF